MPGIFLGRVYLANDSVPRTGDSGTLVSGKPRKLRFRENKPYWAHTVLGSGSGCNNASCVALGGSFTEPQFSHPQAPLLRSELGESRCVKLPYTDGF